MTAADDQGGELFGPEEAVAVAPVPGSGRRVLVAGDDYDFRASVATVLEEQGYSVVEAETGEQALELAKSDPPALVVLSVALPGMSGDEVCRHLRNHLGDDLPIIFVSGAGAESLDRLARLRIGADAYLGKPLAPATLLIRVEKLIRRSNPSTSDASVATDARLPQLTALTERKAAARALAEVFGEPVEVLAVAVVRHQPGRRCTLRYELQRRGTANSQRIYAKTYVSRRTAARVHRTLSAAAAANGVRFPEPLGYLPRLHLVLQARLEGRSATPRLLAGDEALASRIAEIAFALHTSNAKLEGNHRLHHELASLDARVAGLPPDLAARAQDHRAAAEAALTPLRWRRRPVHRDFHEGQVVVDANGRLGLLDVDNAAISEPAVDVARFLARLQLLALKKPESRAAVAASAAAFRTTYFSLDRQLDRRLLRALEATTLLRLACLDLERGGQLAEELIDLSGTILERLPSPARRSGRPGGGAPSGRAKG
jgi:DNA-binding response OmpR family regulator